MCFAGRLVGRRTRSEYALWTFAEIEAETEAWLVWIERRLRGEKFGKP